MEDVEKIEDEQEIVTEEQHDNAQDEVDEKDWKAEALKHKAIADRLKNKLSNQKTIIQPKQEHDDEVVKTVNRLAQLEDKRQFGFDNQLSPEETDFIFKISGGKPTKEILKDPFVESGLEGYRTKKRLEANIPGSSSRSTIFAEKSFSETPEEDRKKIFESRMKGVKVK